MPRLQTSLILLVGALAAAALPAARAQAPADAAAGADTAAAPAAPGTAGTADTAVVYRREVFGYDRRGRPDPFRPLLTLGDLGIRLADLQLRGIVYNTNRRASVAVFSHADTAQSLRMREGSRFGNVTVLRIQPRRVDVRVDEFGTSRVESIPLSRPTPGVYGSGGAPAAAPAGDAAPAQAGPPQAEPAPRRPQPLQRMQARNRQQAREQADEVARERAREQARREAREQGSRTTQTPRQ